MDRMTVCETVDPGSIPCRRTLWSFLKIVDVESGATEHARDFDILF